MTSASGSGNIWREQFNPQPIHIPRPLYYDFLPCAEVVLRPVYDEFAVETDAIFQEAIGRAFQRVKAIVARIQPSTIQISLRQLVEQIPSILSGSQSVLRVFIGWRLVKTIPVDRALISSCRTIQRILLERLLLFEDLQSILKGDEVDTWTETFDNSAHTLVRIFRKGAKLYTLIKLVQASAGNSNKVVVFVRNIPVCENVARAIAEEGILTEFIHGNINETDRKLKLENFRNGKSCVLVVTRQLFGRGFDIPQADIAIFYSPKESERIMWQEMLRVRGTIKFPKKAFVLYYAWTSETDKMLRLLRGILRTNAIWVDNCLRWTYAEVETNESERETSAPKYTQKQNDRERSSITSAFLGSVLNNFQAFMKLHADQIAKTLIELAENVGFLQTWPHELVRLLISELGVTIESLAASGTVDNQDRIKKVLAKVFHPDKHPSALGVEKQFWHELFIGLKI